MHFPVDVNFYDHPKFVDLPMAPRGLWITCGAWCKKHLTDGVIPASQVRKLGGTPGQIKALVEHGLWSESVQTLYKPGTNSVQTRVKIYKFESWFDHNLSREIVEERRLKWRNLKQKSRNRKQSDQQEGENVHRGHPAGLHPDVHTDVHTDVHGDVHESVPFLVEVEVEEGGEVTGSHKTARVEVAPTPKNIDSAVDDAVAAFAADSKAKLRQSGEPSEWSTPDDPRCRDHAGLPRDQVPPCGACARARKWFEQREQAKKREHWDAINACSMCDERGFVSVPDGSGSSMLVRCDHQTWPNSQNLGQKSDFQPETTQRYRNELLSRLWDS